MPDFEKAKERLKKLNFSMMVYTGAGFSVFYVVLNRYVFNNRFQTSIVTVFLLAVVMSFVLQSFSAKTKKETKTEDSAQQKRLEELYGKDETKNADSNWKRDY